MRFITFSARYILSVYITGIAFFTFFRIVLILANMHELHGVPGAGVVMGRAMFMGLRFDTVISGYVLALPSVVLVGAELAGVLRKWLFSAMHFLLCLLYSLCFFICAADIPFYINYSNRLNITILNWTASPLFMAKMVLQDVSFAGYLILFIVITALFIVCMRRLHRRFKVWFVTTRVRYNAGIYLSRVLFSLLFLGCMLLGIRGRTDEKSPIVPGTAYFCNYNMPNQAGLNPVFTFMWSWTDGWKDENKKLTLIDDREAIKNARYYLHLPGSGDGAARYVTGSGQQRNYNVVVVIMESMSAYYMRHFGNDMGLTPNLDSLADNGYLFTNFYSAGIHTFNGIFSTLYGYPALMARHTMEGAVIPRYTGMPYFFRQRGYETLYFTTHDDQFDNVGGFLSANYMHTIISKKDYPGSEIRNTLGVADHFMFGFSLPLLGDQYKQHKPFLAVYMTATNHNPYMVPPGIPFTPKHTEVRGGCVEYADWAIGQFMAAASAMPWYDSTIFVFLGDHGASEGAPYGNMPLWYSHIPCIIYSPIFRRAKEVTGPGGQIDVFPTIAGLLGGDYFNNTLGIDLLHSHRQWMYFSQDDKTGTADTANLYIWQKNGPEYMFDIATRKDILQNQRPKADSMRTYALGMIQYAQWLRDNNKTGMNK